MTRYPLAWPPDWRRTTASDRRRTDFGRAIKAYDASMGKPIARGRRPLTVYEDTVTVSRSRADTRPLPRVVPLASPWRRYGKDTTGWRGCAHCESTETQPGKRGWLYRYGRPKDRRAARGNRTETRCPDCAGPATN